MDNSHIVESPPIGWIGSESNIECVESNTATTGRLLWLELHTKEDPTPEWFETWVARVPNFDCGCRSWLREYLVTNPPRYNDWYPWTVELHNAVNVKRGVDVWTPPADSATR